MKQIQLYIAIVLLILSSGCFPKSKTEIPWTGKEGSIIIYLQPFLQTGRIFRFGISSVFAIGNDGSHIPLTSGLTEIKSSFSGKQRKFASGSLPSGEYSGIGITIKTAFLEGEDGEAALAVPDKPVSLKRSFHITPNEVMTLFFSFDSSSAIRKDVFFTPSFTPVLPGNILSNLIGFVSNPNGHFVSVFNKREMQVTGGIPTGKGPMGMALDQKRGKLYIAASKENSIDVVDLFKLEVTDNIMLNFGDDPVEVALSPDGKTLLAVNNGSNTVSVIDTNLMLETERIRVSERPVSALFHPSGLKAFVMIPLSNVISVIDLYQNGISARLFLDGEPERGVFSRNGNVLYVIGSDSPNLSVIDVSLMRVTHTIFAGMANSTIIYDKRMDLIYTGGGGVHELAVITPLASMYIDTVDLIGVPSDMTIDKEENTLFAVIPEKKILQKLNLTSKKYISEIEIAEGAYAVVVMGEI